MNRTQVIVALHLLIFIAAALLAYYQGQDLQRSWIIHPIITCFLFLRKFKGKPKEIYVRLFYLNALPTMFLYKFFSL